MTNRLGQDEFRTTFPDAQPIEMAEGHSIPPLMWRKPWLYWRGWAFFAFAWIIYGVYHRVIRKTLEERGQITHEEAIRRMEAHLKQEADGTFTLAVQNAEDIGIDPVIFADLRRSLEQTNKNVRDGVYRVGDEWEWKIN